VALQHLYEALPHDAGGTENAYRNLLLHRE
jgi:hypothetical protein